MEEFTTKMTEAEATGEVLVNKTEFDAAAARVAKKMAKDPDPKDESKFIVPLMGMAFASEMAEILFSNKED